MGVEARGLVVEPVGDEQWVIIRCRSLDTLPLAGELVAEGASGWCPVFVVHIRRAHHRRPETVRRPLLPGFLFVPINSLKKAVALRNTRQVRNFSIFRFNAQIATIYGHELEPLKQFAQAKPSRQFAQRIEAANRPRPGERAMVIAGPFSSMVAKVLASGASYSMIEINRLKIQIATCLLTRIQP